MTPAFARAFALFVLIALPCCAGEVSIRLVEATNDGQGSSGGLGDIVEVLRQNLKYSHYRLVAACTMPMPATGGSAQLGTYRIKCSGPQSNLSVAVSHGSREVLRTTVFLQSGKPFMLGGLPGRTGKLILVFVLQ